MTIAADAPPARPSALLPRRLAALFYDVWPVLALWMLVSAVFTVGYTLAGHAARENIHPFSARSMAARSAPARCGCVTQSARCRCCVAALGSGGRWWIASA
jgi:hypothetical protein